MTISENRIERAAKAIDAATMADYQRSQNWDDAKDVVECLDYPALARAALEADAPELAAAEARGRVEGLREARLIAGAGHFLMKAPKTMADGVLFHVRQTQAAIDARISALSKAKETLT